MHVFTSIYDGEVVPHVGEAEDFCWRGLDAIREDVAVRKTHYTPWFRLYAQAAWFEKSPAKGSRPDRCQREDGGAHLPCSSR